MVVSSSRNAISPQNSAGFTSGGFSDSQSLGISCQPLTSADAGAEQDEDDDEDDGQAEPVRKKGRKAKGGETTIKPKSKKGANAFPKKPSGPGRPKRDLIKTFDDWMDHVLTKDQEDLTYTTDSGTESRWLKRHSCLLSDNKTQPMQQQRGR